MRIAHPPRHPARVTLRIENTTCSSSILSDILYKMSKSSKRSRVEELYCDCRKPENGFMILCELCGMWFHAKCVGLTPTLVKTRFKDADWFCARCTCYMKVHEKMVKEQAQATSQEIQDKLQSLLVKRDGLTTQMETKLQSVLIEKDSLKNQFETKLQRVLIEKDTLTTQLETKLQDVLIERDSLRSQLEIVLQENESLMVKMSEVVAENASLKDTLMKVKNRSKLGSKRAEMFKGLDL